MRKNNNRIGKNSFDVDKERFVVELNRISYYMLFEYRNNARIHSVTCGRSVDTIVRYKKRIINIYEDERLSPTCLHARCNDYDLEFTRVFCLYTKINCRIFSFVSVC